MKTKIKKFIKDFAILKIKHISPVGIGRAYRLSVYILGIRVFYRRPMSNNEIDSEMEQ